MDDDKLRRDEHASVMRSRNLFLGVTLIVVGVLWMMNNLELLSDSLFDVVFSWQMLLVLIGGYLLAVRKWLAGGIVAAVGLCLLLIDQLDWHIPLDKIAVPTILIAVGLSVVFSRRKYEWESVGAGLPLQPQRQAGLCRVRFGRKAG